MLCKIPFFSIQQTSYPFLVLSDEQSVLPWDFGRMFVLKIASRFIRITARGMQFSTTSSLSQVFPPRHYAWDSKIQCDITIGALCRENRGLSFFPDSAVDIPYDFANILVHCQVSKRLVLQACEEHAQDVSQ